MSILSGVTWDEVKQHYRERHDTHKMLLRLYRANSVKVFVELALGISNSNGNYSAWEHNLGPRILSQNQNAQQRVFDLVAKFVPLADALTVPVLVKDARISYLAISVGSEISCLIRPEICWVANTRTIWTHLVIKHDGDFDRANEELQLYRDSDDTSEMAYRKWKAIHAAAGKDLAALAIDGEQRARSVSVEPGALRYLWADAIANWLYDYHHN